MLSVTPEPQKISGANEQGVQPDPVVLDISRYEGGNTCYEGNLNYFRLHASGRLEYDTAAAGSPCGHVERKQAQLSAADVGELVALAEQPDFLTADAEYPAFIFHMDTFTETTIFYSRQDKLKKILVKNPAPTDVKAKTHYPPSLASLLRKVMQIRGELGEQW